MNSIARFLLPVLVCLTTACTSVSQLGQIQEMPISEYERLERSLASYAQVAAWGAVSEGSLDPEEVSRLADSLEALAMQNLVAGVSGFFESSLEGAGWKQSLVLLLAVQLDVYLEQRGFWEQITPRTQTLIFALANALRAGAATPAERAEAERVRRELKAQGAPGV